MDDFSARYAELLTGSYDCVDRIVLNAYYPLGHNPGGFRVWWRRWHDDGDDSLDDAHLMRLAGRFARRVRGWAKANGVPVIDCAAGERKHRIAEDYLRDHTGRRRRVFDLGREGAGDGVEGASGPRSRDGSATWRRPGSSSTTTPSTSWTRPGGI